MRKYFFTALVALIAVSFTSCNKGPKIVTERFLIKYMPSINDTIENGPVTDIETLYYENDTTAIAQEYKRYEEDTRALVKECNEFHQSLSKYNMSERDSLRSEYGKKLIEHRCLMFYTYKETADTTNQKEVIDTKELLRVVRENGANILNSIKYTKENNLRVQFIELNNEIWLRDLEN
jgi:hypothetical protein